MKPLVKSLFTFLIVSFAICVLSGIVDFSVGLYYGGEVSMENPVMSAFSPVALMLCIFGFTGLVLLIKGAENWKVNEKLAKRQIDVAFIMVLTIYGLYEVLLRVPVFV